MSRRSPVIAGLGLLLVAASVRAGGLAEHVDVAGTWDGRADYRTVIAHTTGGVSLAIVGTGSGTAFVNVTTPGAPVEVGFVPGPAGHRTVAAHQNVAYAAGDAGGLQVISLASPTQPVLHTTVSSFTSATHLFIDAGDQVLYAGGTEQGLLGFDIGAPLAPGSLFDPMSGFEIVHGVARRPFAYVATGVSLAVIDISNPPATELYAWVTWPDAASTSTQLSTDRRLALVTDARPGAGRLRVYDVANPGAATLVSATAHATVPGAGAREVSWLEPKAYVAWGEAGLEILDTTDPTAPARVGAYASPAPDAAGIVSVTARTASGLAYALDAAAGLAILAHVPSFGEIDGLVTDVTTQGPAPGITVRVPAVGRHTRTGSDGRYTLALPPGTYEVIFEAFRFEPGTESVTVTAGESVTRDVTIDRLPAGTLRGTVNLGSAGPRERPLHPEGTIVRVLDTPVVFPAGFSGFYIIPGMPAGTYIVEADRFGYDAQQVEVTVPAAGEVVQNFLLAPAPFADNLETDTGWTAGDPDDTATTGMWARLKPIGTGAGYVQPEKDETPDPDSTAFVTANGPVDGWIHLADVDGGRTSVTSPPIDLSGVEEPIFRYYRWFSNDATWETESWDADTFALDVSTDDGTSWTNLETLTTAVRFWPQADFVLSRYVVPSDAVRFRVRVSDAGMPSIVEAAFDDIEVWSGAGLVTLPPTPIDLGSVSVVSTAPGTVTLRWLAPGRYDAFDVERADGAGAPHVVGTVPAIGDRHELVDRSAPPGRLVRYWIVGRGGGGVERVGPFAVRVQGVAPRSVVLASVPNPTGGPATLRYHVADELGDLRAVHVALRLFDAAGRRVVTLLDAAQRPGDYTVTWDGRDAAGRSLPSGVYWYRLETPGGASNGRLVRVR